MIREQWVEAFAERVGVAYPSREEIDAILAFARVSARGSEKTTAPVACWVAGRSGRPVEEVLDMAREISDAE